MWIGAGSAKDCRSFFNANSAGGAGTAARQAAFKRKQVFGIEFAAGRPGLKSRQGTASQGGVVQLETQEEEEGFVLGELITAGEPGGPPGVCVPLFSELGQQPLL